MIHSTTLGSSSYGCTVLLRVVVLYSNIITTACRAASSVLVPTLVVVSSNNPFIPPFIRVSEVRLSEWYIDYDGEVVK